MNRQLSISRRQVLAMSAVGGASQVGSAAPNQAFWMYVGCYTSPSVKGIQLFRFDPRTGNLSAEGIAGEIASPSFLAVHPAGGYLYAVGEVGSFEGKPGGIVGAFSVDKGSGRLTQLNQVSSGGPGPCHISLDRAGRCALVANYSGGSVASYKVSADGRLSQPVSVIRHSGSGPNRSRQEGPHAHSINLSPDQKIAVAADLGLDQLRLYRLNAATAELTPHDPPFFSLAPGAGPRHFAWHPGGKVGYIINELSSTMTVAAWNPAKGTFAEIQTLSTLPSGFTGENSTAEVVAHPSGKAVYGSNRGHNSLAVYSVDPATGKLTPRQFVETGGSTPRNFALDPSGRWLIAANQKSNNLRVFRVIPETGQLEPLGKGAEASQPVCIRFHPAA